MQRFLNDGALLVAHGSSVLDNDVHVQVRSYALRKPSHQGGRPEQPRRPGHTRRASRQTALR
eukprot:7998262-Alexandrium_andersonii.AAC.1